MSPDTVTCWIGNTLQQQHHRGSPTTQNYEPLTVELFIVLYVVWSHFVLNSVTIVY